jgi:hypothetical protein
MVSKTANKSRRVTQVLMMRILDIITWKSELINAAPNNIATCQPSSKKFKFNLNKTPEKHSDQQVKSLAMKRNKIFPVMRSQLDGPLSYIAGIQMLLQLLSSV